jgi:hypothetical protein
MTDLVLTYECHLTDREHDVPGPDVRIMRIGDLGFVVACDCADEPLAEADEEPHPTVDHLVNIYWEGPSPEQWLTLEDHADGWYGTTAFETPESDKFDGTHGQRRQQFRDKVENVVGRNDGRDLENTETQKQVRRVECPYCGASRGRKCQRPSGHRVRKNHADRRERAEEEGVLDTDGADAGDQASLGDWPARDT